MTPMRNLATFAFFAGGTFAAQLGEVLINPLRDENGNPVLEKRQNTASTVSLPESEATVIMSLFTGEDGSAATTPASISIPESEATIIMSVLPTDSLSTATSSDLTLTHESARTGPTAAATAAASSASTATAGNGVATSIDTELLRLGLPVVLFIAALLAM